MLKKNLLLLLIFLFTHQLLFAGSAKTTKLTSNLNSLGRCFIISIGVNDYPYLSQKYPELSFHNCVSDARGIDSFFN